MTSDFTQFILDQLTGLGVLRARCMFGGVGIYCDEAFFAVIYQDALYLKVDDVNRTTFEQAGSAAFKPFALRATTLHYWSVPAEVMEDSRLLRDWARGALAAAQRMPAKKPPLRLKQQPR